MKISEKNPAVAPDPTGETKSRAGSEGKEMTPNGKNLEAVSKEFSSLVGAEHKDEKDPAHSTPRTERPQYDSSEMLGRLFGRKGEEAKGSGGSENEKSSWEEECPDTLGSEPQTSDTAESVESDPARSFQTDLERLSSFHMVLPGEPAQVASKHEVPLPREIPQVVDELVDRILVSNRQYSDKEEVRIILKDSFLEGSEIRISKEGEGIRITVVANSADSYQFLFELKGAMGSDLKEKLDRDVEVEVHLSESGQQNEGRSRQRRSVVDEREV